MITFRKYREMEFRGLLIELVKLLQPEVYCEIGVKRGYTFNEIAKLTALRKAAIGIDPAGFSQSTKEIQSNIMKTQRGKQIILFDCTSDEYAKHRRNKGGYKIDFLFIDGDHSAEQVEKDLMQLLPYVQEDTGLIFLHDTYPVNQTLATKGYCHDAWKVASIIHEAGFDQWRNDLEIVTIPGPWAGLSILRKRGNDHLHWMNTR